MSFTQKLKVETGSMEIAALFGLLGLGYGVSRVSQHSREQPLVSIMKETPMQQNRKAAHSIPPADRQYPLLTRSSGSNEGFIPAARGPNTDPLTVAPKGASAVGFGPDLDMMYQASNGQTILLSQALDHTVLLLVMPLINHLTHLMQISRATDQVRVLLIRMSL